MLLILPQKLFLFSRYLQFCFAFLAIYKNGLIRKLRLTSKLMTLPPGRQTESLTTLPKLPLPLQMPTLSKSSSCKSISALLEGTSHEQNTRSSYLNYLFHTSFHLGSPFYFALWCKKSSIICTKFLLLNNS